MAATPSDVISAFDGSNITAYKTVSDQHTGLLEIIGIVTTCHTQYTSDSSM